MLKNKFLLTYISIFIFIIWEVLWTYIFKKESGSNTGGILLFFIMIAIFDNIKKKKYLENLFKKPIIFWFLWIIVSFLNTYFNVITLPENKSISVFMFLIIPVLIVLAIQLLKLTELKTAVNVFIFCLIFQTCMSLVFDSFGYGNGGYRFGIEFNSNLIAFTVVILYLMNMIKNALFESSKKLNIFISIITVVLLLMTQSRKSAFVFVIILIGQRIIFSKGHKTLRLFKISIFLSSLALLLNFAISNSNIGNRTIDMLSNTKDANNEEQMFEGRLVQYIEGYKIFKSSPVLGIGLLNYRVFDRYELELHSEYLVQLVETGLIGSLLFLLFYGYIIFHLFKIKSNSIFKKTANVLILSLLAYFVLFFGAWIYNVAMFWLIIGIAIKVISLDKEKSNRKLSI